MLGAKSPLNPLALAQNCLQLGLPLAQKPQLLNHTFCSKRYPFSLPCFGTTCLLSFAGVGWVFTALSRRLIDFCLLSMNLNLLKTPSFGFACGNLTKRESPCGVWKSCKIQCFTWNKVPIDRHPLFLLCFSAGVLIPPFTTKSPFWAFSRLLAPSALSKIQNVVKCLLKRLIFCYRSPFQPERK